MSQISICGTAFVAVKLLCQRWGVSDLLEDWQLRTTLRFKNYCNLYTILFLFFLARGSIE